MTLRAFFVLLIAATLVAGIAAATGGPSWSKFTSSEGRFSVEMPGTPAQTQTKQKSFIGTVTNHIFTAESGADTYTVDYSDIPHFALDFAGPDTIYSHAKGALLLKTYGVETSYTDVTVSGEKGKRLVYDTPKAGSEPPPMRGDAILVLVGTRLYVIDAVVPRSEADAKSVRFLSSIEIEK